VPLRSTNTSWLRHVGKRGLRSGAPLSCNRLVASRTVRRSVLGHNRSACFRVRVYYGSTKRKALSVRNPEQSANLGERLGNHLLVPVGQGRNGDVRDPNPTTPWKWVRRLCPSFCIRITDCGGTRTDGTRYALPVHYDPHRFSSPRPHFFTSPASSLRDPSFRHKTPLFRHQ
jgi:hypothetical protein